MIRTSNVVLDPPQVDAVQPWLRLASYPDRNPGNPYIELFHRALAEHGIEHAGRLQVSSTWFDIAGANIDALHIHWPEGIWRGKRRGRLERIAALLSARSVRGVLRLRRFLRQAGRRGMTRVWTVHNLAHHEGTTAVDRWGYRLLAKHSDLLVCFSRAAEGELRRTYGDQLRVLVISHGSYKGAYPTPRSPASARARLELHADVPVVSCLGLLRRYKGIELACEAVEALRGRVQLLIAGQPHRTFDVAALVGRAASSRGTLVVIPRSLTADEFADAVSASDAVLLPYRAVTGSGILFSAWTMGAGVIASDLPFFREMLDQGPLLGRTFPAGDAAALAAGIEEYLGIPAELRRRAIAATIESLPPERVVVPFVEELRAQRVRLGAGERARRRSH